MNKFKNRLKYYLIGFGLGLVFMFFIFGNRACSWLPENRVKNMIAEKDILIGDSVQYLMNCEKVTNDDIYRLLNDEGDVNFEKSKTSGSPKIYVLEGKKDKKDLSITYALHDSTSEVLGFTYLNSICSTNLSNKNKSVVPVPEFEIITLIESKEMRILDLALCQMECFGLTEKEVQTFHLYGKNMVDRSQPQLSPNPIYWLEGKIGQLEYQFKYVIGENRSRVAEIVTDQECDCSED